MNDPEIAFDDNGQPIRAVGFDYDGVDPANREPDPDATRPDAELLLKIILWQATRRAAAYYGKTLTRRNIALAWTVDPARFGGKSLAQLAREEGISPQAMSRYAARASRVFGLRNRSQRAHGSRWRKPDQPK